MNFNLSHQNGNQFGFSFSAILDTKETPQKRIIDPFYSSSDNLLYISKKENLNSNTWYDRLLYDIEKSGLYLRKAKILPDENKAIIEFSNLQFLSLVIKIIGEPLDFIS